MGDVFIDIDAQPDEQINRMLDRLFGNPNYDQPTAAEFGMQMASLSRTRSPELGLKVGAAVVTDDLSVSNEAAAELATDGSAFVKRLLANELAEAHIRAITEYQLPVHAEMNALLDALRRGVSLEGATVYVTAYPCHSCAKHLVALGLPVRYIEPYPKSRAQAMYGLDVTELFLPFTGIAPRRYEALFSAGSDRKNADGSRVIWSADDRRRVRPCIDSHIDHRGIADREDIAMTIA